jgi:hypothetical protein
MGMETERTKAIRELREKRAARGDSDPLNRLRHIIIEKIATGEKPITEKKGN